MATQSESAQKRFPWRTLLICSCASTSAIVLGFFWHDISIKWAGVANHFIRAGSEIARDFKTGNITTTFLACVPTLTSTKGDVLEVGTLRQEEEFKKSDPEYRVWDLLYLGKTVSEIHVPATFRYHINLSESWRLAAKDGVCVVLAPQFHASTPTAIETDKMEANTQNGWALFNKDDNLARLEASITPELDRRAESPEYRALVREMCRSSVKDFVKRWLVKEKVWSSDLFHQIVVYFPDEVSVSSDAELERYGYPATVDTYVPASSGTVINAPALQ